MKIKRILLTGDDGYNAIGTRILVHYLKNSYDLQIVGTLRQQSGVGGHASLRTGCKYGYDEVDGVPAYWVDGYPVDAIESFVDNHIKPFDLVISGINWGANVGYCIASGTYAAAFQTLNDGLSKKAMIMSRHVPSSHWHVNPSKNADITSFLDYPGKAAFDVFKLAINNDMWSADVLNINFPEGKTNILQFTKPLDDMKQFYQFPVIRDTLNNQYTYPLEVLDETKHDTFSDSGAILHGYISISPLQKNPLDKTVFNNLQHQKISIT
jgi:5'/3'-nucleotidase SurE